MAIEWAAGLTQRLQEQYRRSVTRSAALRNVGDAGSVLQAEIDNHNANVAYGGLGRALVAANVGFVRDTLAAPGHSAFVVAANDVNGLAVAVKVGGGREAGNFTEEVVKYQILAQDPPEALVGFVNGGTVGGAHFVVTEFVEGQLLTGDAYPAGDVQTTRELLAAFAPISRPIPEGAPLSSFADAQGRMFRDSFAKMEAFYTGPRAAEATTAFRQLFEELSGAEAHLIHADAKGGQAIRQPDGTIKVFDFGAGTGPKGYDMGQIIGESNIVEPAVVASLAREGARLTGASVPQVLKAAAYVQLRAAGWQIGGARMDAVVAGTEASFVVPDSAERCIQSALSALQLANQLESTRAASPNVGPAAA